MTTSTKSSANGRPHSSPDLERELLAAVVLSPEAADKALAGRINDEDFTVPENRTLFADLREAHQAGVPFGSIGSLTQWLRDHGTFDLIGGVTAVACLFERDCLPGHADFYCRQLRKLRNERLKHVASDELFKAARDRSANDFTRFAVRRLDRLQRETTELDDVLPFEFKPISHLLNSDEQIRYLIDGILPAGQPGLLGGRFKVLKTTIALDLAVSVASGRPFLGRFEVPEPVNVAIVSGESGEPTLRETVRRVATAKGLEPADLSRLFYHTTIPKLTSAEHLDALKQRIVERPIELIIIDPTYMALSDAGDGASNVLKMGAVLQPVTDLVTATGATVLLVHHFRKWRPEGTGRFDTPELGEFSQSGFAEWGRFWLMLGPRREWDETTGSHWLWLRAGGSLGHAGLWAVDVREGRRDDPGGRVWEATVQAATEARRQEAEDAKIERLRGDLDKAASALRALPGGACAGPWAKTAGIKYERLVGDIAPRLERDGVVRKHPVQVSNHKRPRDGWIHADHCNLEG